MQTSDIILGQVEVRDAAQKRNAIGYFGYKI
jgi:hypothetical protein